MCGKTMWHRYDGNRRRRYVCSSVRRATGTCDAAPVDAGLADRAVVSHLNGLFADFDTWLAEVSSQREAQHDDMVRQLGDLQERMKDLAQDERLFREDYRRQLRDGNERAGQLAAEELERTENERTVLVESIKGLKARTEEFEAHNPADDILDWWTTFSNGVRDGIVNAKSIVKANAALKERFERIIVDSRRGEPAEMEFALRQGLDDPEYRKFEARWIENGKADGYSEEKAKEFARRSWPPLLGCSTEEVEKAEAQAAPLVLT
jgi:hypothetical protein